MANEAELRDRLEHAIDFTVADGTGIPKGTLLKINDPRTAAKSDSTGDTLAGIAAREKVANDGRTRLAVFQKGVFEMVANGAVTVGDAVQSDGTTTENTVVSVTGADGSVKLGTALESATDGDKFQVKVNVGAA